MVVRTIQRYYAVQAMMFTSAVASGSDMSWLAPGFGAIHPWILVRSPDQLPCGSENEISTAIRSILEKQFASLGPAILVKLGRLWPFNLGF